jgi:hypothetical protein
MEGLCSKNAMEVELSLVLARAERTRNRKVVSGERSKRADLAWDLRLRRKDETGFSSSKGEYDWDRSSYFNCCVLVLGESFNKGKTSRSEPNKALSSPTSSGTNCTTISKTYLPNHRKMAEPKMWEIGMNNAVTLTVVCSRSRAIM